MADDKNIKTPDIPAVDTGPGTGQPQASKAGPEKQEPKAAPLPEADKKPEPEAASPNVSVYNFSEIMKGKKNNNDRNNIMCVLCVCYIQNCVNICR